MRVLLWGTYDSGKPRIRLLRDGMRLAGIDVREVHAHVFADVVDKSRIGPLRQFALLLRTLLSYPFLIWRFLRSAPHDLVLVSYPGALDALVLKPFAWLRRVPIAWDVFISGYDTVVDDRALRSARSLVARALWAVEWLAARACALVFLDTMSHARRFEAMFGLPPGSCGSVWVGAEIEKFTPADRGPEQGPRRTKRPLRVLFYGQFAPLHGVSTIVEAARMSQGRDIEWILIGRGQEDAAIERMLAEQPLPNLQCLHWVDYERLRDQIAEADVCLGIFGATGKAGVVIPNKVFQLIAARKPVITRDSPAIRELLEHAPPCVVLVPPRDPRALADAVVAHVRVRDEHRRCHDDSLVGRISAQGVGRQFHELAVARLGPRAR